MSAMTSGDNSESRLDRMIARLVTQRACLQHVATLIQDQVGPVFEIGLGKGRTYSHLSKLFPEREIWAFDFQVHAPAHSQPPAAHILLGDFRKSLPDAGKQVGQRAAFIHADIGTESRRADADLARFVGTQAVRLLKPGGLLLGDRDMSAPGLKLLDLPAVALLDGLSPWPYFLFQAEA